MERTPTLASLVSLLIIFASVVEQTRADKCNERLGPCDGCDQRCKARYGGSCESKCDGIVGMLSCTCIYQCHPRKVCNAGLGNCGMSCNSQCCNAKCAQRYSGGGGFCNNVAGFSVCQCSYPC
ncbi:PREDICTED: defensin-like protein 181 [Camelina sativa]|uniref:Defensin-like protein n=1 Tax=Camelina sativa TaxID=90675 RepID=A0ABM0WKH5_CAMSA|nr:PREDICTED: defensin-like protein 181 [Camelina sativa]